MSRFNTYMNTHFAGCRLLAEGFDACRNREARAFLIPGYFEDVGFTDGTDAWVVPLAAESCTGAGNLMKGVNLRELVGRILNGESPPVQRMAPQSSRRRIALEDDAPLRRRSITTESQESQPAPRRRHVTFA